MLPAVNRNAKTTIAWLRGDERSQDGNVAMVSLNTKVGGWTKESWILEIWRFGVSGNEALCFEFLDGHSGAFREEEDVPVLVTHCVYVCRSYVWLVSWIKVSCEGGWKGTRLL